jgi:F0F1-type ATP synthase assembly protein I
LGYFIDHWLDTAPAFTLGGLALGLITAFVGSYRMITDTLRDMEREAARQKKRRDGA